MNEVAGDAPANFPGPEAPAPGGDMDVGAGAPERAATTTLTDDPAGANAAEPAVEVWNLTKRYGPLIAVGDVSMMVPKGALFGLVGPNGAGKSTMLSMLSGLLLPTAGTMRVLGFNPVKETRQVKERIGYMPDVIGHYDDLTVAEYLAFFGTTYGLSRTDSNERVGTLLDLVELEVKRDAMVDSLSRGMKQRLSLARALVNDPELLILDEPAGGLDPRARVELRELLTQLRSMGKTMIISSHILSELEEMCSHVGIIEAGRVVAYGDTDSVAYAAQTKRAIRVTYVGGDTEEFDVVDDDHQVAMLRYVLVDLNRPVLEVRSIGGGLESVFMELTKGQVQ